MCCFGRTTIFFLYVGLMLTALPALAQTHFESVAPTGNSYGVFITSSGGDVALMLGDEIAVFDQCVCVGVTVFDGTFPIVIAAWEGEPAYDLPGFVPGRSITFRVWDVDANCERTATGSPAGIFGQAPFYEGALTVGETMPHGDWVPTLRLFGADDQAMVSGLIQCATGAPFYNWSTTGNLILNDTQAANPIVSGGTPGQTASLSVTFGDGGGATPCPFVIEVVTATTPAPDPDIALLPMQIFEEAESGNETTSTLTIHNHGQQTLQADLSSSEAWLTLSQSNVTVNPNSQTELIINLDATELGTGTYLAQIDITTNDPDEPTVFIPVQFEVLSADTDGDGIPNLTDNCPNTPNPTQADCDQDDIGDVCDNTDNLPPVAMCQNIVRFLDENGQVTIAPTDVDIGSFDSCGDVSLTLDTDTFNCAQTGAQTVTLTVTDDAGLNAVCEAVVMVADTTAPQIITPCADLDTTLYVTENCEALLPDFTQNLAIVENCQTGLTVTQTPAAGTSLSPGSYAVILSVADAAGYSDNCTVVVTVVDAMPPQIQSDCSNFTTTLFADTDCQAMLPDFTTTVIASDNCSIPAVTQSPLPGTMIDFGAHTITLTATDEAGLTDVCSFTITVADTIPPQFSGIPPNQTVSADAIPQVASVDASDNCDPDVIVTFSETATGYCPTIIERTWIAEDASGNSVSASQTITVLDSDADADGICDNNDNCPFDANTDQQDANDDGIGDACTAPPVMVLQPETVERMVVEGQMTTAVVSIANMGSSALNWRTTAPTTVSKALDFDGLNDLVYVESHPDLNPGDGNFTVECWFKIGQADTTPQHLVGKGDINNGYRIFWQDGHIVFATMGVQVSVPVATNDWHHVAGVKSGSMVQLYLDGTLAALLQTGSNTAITNESPFTMGRQADVFPVQPYQGSLDEIRYWHVARTPEQIADTWQRSLSGFEPGMIAYWRCDEGIGQWLFDVTGQEHHGWLGNGLTNERPQWIVSGAAIPSPWLTVTPVLATVAEDEVVDLTLTLDAADLLPGAQTRLVQLVTNDPTQVVVNIPVNLQVTSSEVIDFSHNLTVNAATGDSVFLTFGTAADATPGFDPDYDQMAPTPQPNATYAHFSHDDLILTRDYQPPNTTVTVWPIVLHAAPGAGPLTVEWDHASLPWPGHFWLRDASGTRVNINMRTQSSLVVPANITQLFLIDSNTYFAYIETEETAIFELTAAHVDGEPLQPGEEVGVFDGDLCVGTAVFEGDYPLTISAWRATPGGVWPGFAPNHVATFRVWDGATETSSLCQAIYSQGNGTFGYQPDSIFELDCTAGCVTSTIVNTQQFNLLSLPIEPHTSEIEAVFGSLEGLEIVQTCDGRAYIPDYDINTIGHVVPGEAYLTYISGVSDHWFVPGDCFDVPPVIELLPHWWNCIGFTCDAPVAIADAMADIETQIKIVKTSTGHVWIPQLGVNTIGHMQPGLGYWLFLKDLVPDVIPFSFDCQTSASLLSENNTYPHFLPMVLDQRGNDLAESTVLSRMDVLPTGLSYPIVIDRTDFLEFLQVGDEIGVFVGEQCVGSARFGGEERLVVPTWQAVPEQGLMGFEPGQPISVAIWHDDEIIPVEADYKVGDGRFGSGPYAQVSLLPKDEGEVVRVPTETRLMQNYPNPFNPRTEIRFELAHDGPVTLTVYDVNGRLVKRLIEASFSAGSHRTFWNGERANGESVASGVYFYELQSPEGRRSRRMLLLK